LRKEIDRTVNAVQSVASDELTLRVKDLLKKVASLEQQLASLQQIIDPKGASEILTIARMRDEIFAREKFETVVNDSLKETNHKVESLQTWVLGLAGSAIATLLTFSWILLRRTSSLYYTVQSLEAELKTRSTDDKRPNEAMHR